jgi:hypothetical protein
MVLIQTAWQQASTEMYANQGGGQSYGPGGYAQSNGGQHEPDVADVEYEEVKEDKR